MKIILVLAVAAALIIAALLFFGSGDLDLTAPPKKPLQAGATPPPQDFHAVTALLAKDMSSVPVALDAPEFEPVNAFNVKSRLDATTAARQEYQVLAKACELIIYAAQEHTVQRAAAGSTHAATYARAQADWDGYRQQTDTEVKRLLGSLDHPR